MKHYRRVCLALLWHFYAAFHTRYFANDTLMTYPFHDILHQNLTHCQGILQLANPLATGHTSSSISHHLPFFLSKLKFLRFGLRSCRSLRSICANFSSRVARGCSSSTRQLTRSSASVSRSLSSCASSCRITARSSSSGASYSPCSLTCRRRF